MARKFNVLDYVLSVGKYRVELTRYYSADHEVAGNVFSGEEKKGFFRWRNPGKNPFPIFFSVGGTPLKGAHPETVAAKAAALAWAKAGHPVVQAVKEVQATKRRGINSWSEAELNKLGFTDKITKAIVEEREANGSFSGPEDLVSRVKGLGPKTWEKIQKAWRANHAPKAKETAKAASSEA